MSAAMIERQALSVTQVNLYIKEIMNRDVVLTDILSRVSFRILRHTPQGICICP